MTGRGVGDLVEEQAELLHALPGFNELDAASKRRLLQQFTRHSSPAGTVLIRQGEPAQGLFVLVDGHVRVIQRTATGTTELNLLGPGAVFGEMSFVRESGASAATVVADSAVEYAMLPAGEFAAALDASPGLTEAITHNTTFRHRANLLAHIFHDLDATARRSLADAVKAVDVDAGQIIVRQGEPGKRAYVLTEGEANVVLESLDRPNRVIATLHPGDLVGEASLLTDAPRDASVVMTTPGRVLALSRKDLLEAAGSGGKVSAELVSLLRMRWRPRQLPGVEVTERTSSEGERIVVLKDREQARYYRMAADGAFIWEQLDGETTLRDIAMAYLEEYGVFAPDRIAQAVHDLVVEGFATTAPIADDLVDPETPRGAGALAIRAIGALAWTKGVSGVDRWFERLHRVFGFLFTRPGVALLSLVALAGVILTIADAPRSGNFIEDAGGAVVLLGLIPANAIGAFLHEAAHGLAVKHFGREVSSAGIGWYLITPVTFVDTSDMWLEDRRKRALVSAAGPFANLVVAGVAATAATILDSPLVVAIMWQFVIASYYLALVNLNPLLEFDGYYILSDFLDRPNLRDDALRWIGSELPSALRDRSKLRGHGVELVYGLLALAFIVLVGFFMLVVYRLVLQGLVERIVPRGVASGLAWLFALAVASIAALGTWAQMRGLTTPRH